VVASVVAPTAAAQAATIDLDAQIRQVNFVSISHLTVDTPAVGDSTSSITVSLPDEVTIDYDLSETYWAITNVYNFVVSPTPVTNVVGADVVLPITPGALF